jgi:tRNA threonylcarbamoyladenosine biosynthesis protein TsaB
VIVLGLDTATPSTVAGVLLADGRVAEARDDPADGGRGAHAAKLLVLAERALTDAGVSWDDLDRLAVGVGPGGFTGLRIGIATARALAQGRGLPLVPVSSLAALAAGATPAAVANGAPLPLIAAVIDARRGEVFAAVHRGDHTVVGPAALAPSDLADRLLGLDEPVQAVGDGAVRFREELEGAGVAVPADGSSVHRIGAGPLCRLGAVGEPAEREALLPDYQREPDAKPPTR